MLVRGGNRFVQVSGLDALQGVVHHTGLVIPSHALIRIQRRQNRTAGVVASFRLCGLLLFW